MENDKRCQDVATLDMLYCMYVPMVWATLDMLYCMYVCTHGMGNINLGASPME